MSSGLSFVPLLFLLVGCADAPRREDRPPPEAAVPATQEVDTYRTCEFAAPGELIALPREAPADLDPVAAAITELLRGVTAAEQTRGCTSFFSSATEGTLNAVRYDAASGEIVVDFRDFSDAIPDEPGARSFLPPGVMAELTWTIFHQFAQIRAARFAFDGDEAAFWSWVAGEPAEPRTFTRAMWERV